MTEEAQDTELKIKNAARKVFLEQGYEGAKIRQIADEAGVNLAMVNYYFRSKEQLFKSIFTEMYGELLSRIAILLNEETPLEVKIWKIVDRYTDFIVANPLAPKFILSELRKGEVDVVSQLGVKGILQNSFFRKQLIAEAEKGNIRPIEPIQVVTTILSCVIFPIMAKPIVSHIGDLSEESYARFIEERKRIIPEMVMAHLRAV